MKEKYKKHNEDRHFIVAVDGLRGAGKTTLANQLKSIVRNVVIIHIDDHIVEKANRYNTRHDEWFEYYQLQWDTDFLKEHLFNKLFENERNLSLPFYNKEKDTVTDSLIRIFPRSIVFIEGIFLLRKEWQTFYDYIIFLDCHREIRYERVLHRDTYIGNLEERLKKYHVLFSWPAQDTFILPRGLFSFKSHFHLLQECCPFCSIRKELPYLRKSPISERRYKNLYIKQEDSYINLNLLIGLHNEQVLKVFASSNNILCQPISMLLGKILVGIIIGPALLDWVSNGPLIQQFAEIGVLLLMFMAGLETDLNQLRKNWKPALAVALGGIILPFSGAFLVGEIFNLGLAQSLFLGVLSSATSVSSTVQVLKELNKMDTKESATILGAAVVDDVLVVTLLAVIISFLASGDSGSSSIGLLIAKKGIFFIAVFIVGWLIVPKAIEWFSKLKVTEPAITIGLIICFAFAYFGELLGMAGIIGAFAAGLAISQTAYKHNIEKKVESISYSVFVPISFVSIGLNVSFDGVMDQIWLLFLLTVVAVLTKLFGGAIGAKLTGNSYQSSLAIGS